MRALFWHCVRLLLVAVFLLGFSAVCLAFAEFPDTTKTILLWSAAGLFVFLIGLALWSRSHPTTPKPQPQPVICPCGSPLASVGDVRWQVETSGLFTLDVSGAARPSQEYVSRLQEKSWQAMAAMEAAGDRWELRGALDILYCPACRSLYTKNQLPGTSLDSLPFEVADQLIDWDSLGPALACRGVPLEPFDRP